MNLPSGDVDLTGRVALVTGASRGLGREFAFALAKAGATVAVTARTQAGLDETVDLIITAGGRSSAYPVDVTDKVGVENAVERIEEELGPVDILVNNAGLITPLGFDGDLDADEWWQTLNINVNGAYICTRAVMPSMIARNQGRIINISSSGAHTVHPYATAYCASKAALTSFTNCLAPALKDYGVYVFALAPQGPTAMHELLSTLPSLSPERRASSRRVMEETGAAAMESSVKLLLFLASGKADSLTGRHIGFRDSEQELLSRSNEIVKDDLYVLRLRK